MKLSLGISPCPNDTFIFDAMLNGKIDTEGLHFDCVLEDVETLNKLALAASLDISKVSYGAAGSLLTQYRILGAGGALGKGVGPLLVAKNQQPGQEIPTTALVALPGVHTTAHLLFGLAFPDMHNKVFLPFHEIEDAVLTGKADLGVIIHESRFTYQEKGLFRLADLGDLWESNTGFPIPLGGIVAKKKWGDPVLKTIDRVIRKSVLFALKQPAILPSFVTDHAQEMKPEVMLQHIALYVNDFSVQLGETGRAAVCKLLEVAAQVHRKEIALDADTFVLPRVDG